MEDIIVQGLKAQLAAIEAEREALVARRHRLWLAANRLRKSIEVMEEGHAALAFPEQPITNTAPEQVDVGYRIVEDREEAEPEAPAPRRRKRKSLRPRRRTSRQPR